MFALLAGVKNGQTYEATKALERERPAQQVQRQTKNPLITPAKNRFFTLRNPSPGKPPVDDL
jgi:hypothetical protein